MKTKLQSLTITLVLIFISAIFHPILAQDEYDDMYYSSNDRKKKKRKKEQASSYYYQEKEESNPLENYNPAYIQQYKDENANENVQYYYDTSEEYDTIENADEYADEYYYEDQPLEVHNYYGNVYAGSQYDPSMSYGLNVSPYGWSMGFSYGWGGGYYDPFFNPMYSYNMYRWYNPYYYGYPYCYGYPYYGDGYYTTTNATRGARYSRGSVVANRNSNLNRLSSVEPSRGRSSVVRTGGRKTRENSTIAKNSRVKTSKKYPAKSHNNQQRVRRSSDEQIKRQMVASSRGKGTKRISREYYKQREAARKINYTKHNNTQRLSMNNTTAHTQRVVRKSTGNRASSIFNNYKPTSFNSKGISSATGSTSSSRKSYTSSGNSNSGRSYSSGSSSSRSSSSRSSSSSSRGGSRSSGRSGR